MQTKVLFFAGKTRLGASRCAVGRRRELRVAAAAKTSLGDEHALAVACEVRDLDELVVTALVDDGSDRHLQLDVAAGAARALDPSRGATVGGEFFRNDS